MAGSGEGASRVGWKQELAAPRYIENPSERKVYYEEKISDLSKRLWLLGAKTSCAFGLFCYSPDKDSPDLFVHTALRNTFTDEEFLGRCVRDYTDFNMAIRQAERTGLGSFSQLGLPHGEAVMLLTEVMERLKRSLKWKEYSKAQCWAEVAAPPLSFAAAMDEAGIPYCQPKLLKATDETAAGQSKARCRIA